MPEVSGFSEVSSPLTQSIEYGNSSVDGHIHEMFDGLSPAESRITIGQQSFVITQTVRSLAEGISPVSSPLLTTINTDRPLWAVGLTGVNSTIRESLDFGLFPIDSHIETVTEIYGLVPVFGRIEQGSGGGGGGIIPPIDPSVEIPGGRESESGMDYRVYLDGEDVTKYVTSCKVSFSRDKFCGEVDITWSTSTLFLRLHCLPVSPSLRLQVDVRHYIDLWRADGTGLRTTPVIKTFSFFLEKRNASLLFGDYTISSWGRSVSASLASPYAKKYAENLPILADAIESGDMIQVSELFVDICESVGIAEDYVLWELLDYQIRPGKFSVVGMYPIEALQRLAEVVGGIIITDRFAPVDQNAMIVRAVYKYPV